MTLQATPDIARVVDGLIREGRITQSAVDYARSQGYQDADIIASRDKARLSAARLEIQGAPLRYKPQEIPPNPSQPTRERQIKGGRYLTSQVVGRGEATPLRRYRLRSVMEIHGDKFEDKHRMAFAAFVGDADLHLRVKVADLNSRGGGSNGRLGGLGNAPQHVRDRHARYEWVSSNLTRLERQVCDVLVTHCIHKRDGSPFTAEEYGALVYPMLADKSFHRGAAVNGFMHLVDHLVELLHSPSCPRIRWNADGANTIEDLRE